MRLIRWFIVSWTQVLDGVVLHWLKRWWYAGERGYSAGLRSTKLILKRAIKVPKATNCQTKAPNMRCCKTYICLTVSVSKLIFISGSAEVASVSARILKESWCRVFVEYFQGMMSVTDHGRLVNGFSWWTSQTSAICVSLGMELLLWRLWMTIWYPFEDFIWLQNINIYIYICLHSCFVMLLFILSNKLPRFDTSTRTCIKGLN